MTTILGIGTYPIRLPIHGGQRRVSSIQCYYQKIGVKYDYISLYNPGHYDRRSVSAGDFPFIGHDRDFPGIPFIEDLRAGMQAPANSDVMEWFLAHIKRANPDYIQLEQPFLLPLAEEAQTRTATRKFGLIHSSQNVEAPLKDALLRNAGISAERRRNVVALIDDIEFRASQSSVLTLCCSVDDAAVLSRASAAPPVVVLNGVDRPPLFEGRRSPLVEKVFKDRRFLLVVGSAYPPNIEGVHDLIVKDGLHYLPPRYSMAVCGGMSDGVYQGAPYLRFLEANNQRAHFFPTPSDSDLWELKMAAHAILLPIKSGGGTNLKTAEALSLGKWIVATDLSLRGYDAFRSVSGITIANTTVSFQRAAHEVLQRPALVIDDNERALRDQVYWDRCFANSNLAARLEGLIGLAA